MPSSDGSTIFLRATFGILVSRDAGKTWQWICERALGYEGSWDPPIAVTRDGRLWVGLDQLALTELARAEAVSKVSRQNLAHALAGGGWGGTTVSATMIAARLAGIRVFATGGIGGVHRGAARTFDVSADLDELARTPVLVVCSGPKSILDIDLTLEILETRGVPLIALGTRELPGFYSSGSGRAAPLSVSGPDEAAAVAVRHWSLGLGTGLVVALPVPRAAALPFEEARAATDEAIADADAQGIRGAASTPWLLARVAELTGGRSTEANVALIENNALVAARIARALAELTAAQPRP
ncbi:MAG: pseudouridine-5'-phosphate glycosidase [Chloroflexi bacterium]|nr:pseudouridine-5'-phosphate glycosidase [Chloroflexota bacterium]